jgi:hypothetical protein
MQILYRAVTIELISELDAFTCTWLDTDSCSLCLAATSLGSWSGGPASSGTTWAGGLFIFNLPPGWIWSGLPAGCVLLSPDSGDTLQYSGASETGYIPPTYP